MRKIVKITAIVVVSILAVALIVPSLMSGTVADIVKREANTMLKARLDFGKLDISLLRHFPHASVEITDLTLVGSEPFEGDTIVSAERVSVVVNLLSLFSDEGFEVNKVLLSTPSVNARKLADGAVNWDVMRPSDEPAVEEVEEESEESPSSFKLQVEEFRISDATIMFRDDSSHVAFRTSPLALRLRGDMSADKTNLDLRLTADKTGLESGGVPLMSDVNIDLKADVAADFVARRFTFNENSLMLNAVALSLDGWAAMTDRGWDMDIKAGCDRVMFKDLLSLLPAFYTRDFKELSASGELSLGVMAKGEMYGRQLPKFELSAGIKDGSFRYASLPRAVSDIQMTFKVTNPGGVMDKTVVDLSRFSLRMGDNALALGCYATNLASDPYVKFSTKGRLDLGMVHEVYPLEKDTKLGGAITADIALAGNLSAVEKGAYQKIDGGGRLTIEELGLTVPTLPDVKIRRAAASVTPQAMTLGELDVKVGHSDIVANGQVVGYLGYLLRDDKLSGRLYVKSNLLDFNEIMNTLPDSEVSVEEAPEEEEAAPATGEVAPLRVPENINLSLNTDIAKVRLAKMEMDQIKGNVSMNNGVLSLDNLSMKLFDGSAVASGSYSTAEDPMRPALKLSLRFTDASFAKTFDQLEMIQKMVPIFAKTGGNYSLGMEMSANLNHEMAPDVMSVNAAGGIRSKNIKLQQLEVFDKLATMLNNQNLRNIEARDVAIDFAIRNGRVYTEPFDLKLAGVDLNLSGSTGLDQSIDYVAKVKLPNASAKGVLQNVNVLIGGTFSSPKISVGVKEAAQEAVRNIIEDQIGSVIGDKPLSQHSEKLMEEARRGGAQLIEKAKQQRDKLVEEASKKGKLAELAARKAGDKLVAEAERQAQKMVDKAAAQVEKNAPKADSTATK